MKRILMGIAAAGLAVPAQFAMTTPAHAGYNNIDNYCKALIGSGAEPATNIGECVSLLTVQFHAIYDDGRGGNSYAQHACDYYEEAAPEFFYSNWDSKQDCMAEIFE